MNFLDITMYVVERYIIKSFCYSLFISISKTFPPSLAHHIIYLFFRF